MGTAGSTTLSRESYGGAFGVSRGVRGLQSLIWGQVRVSFERGVPEILLFCRTNCLGFVLMKIYRGRKRKPSLEVVRCWVPKLEPDFGPISLSFHSFFFF